MPTDTDKALAAFNKTIQARRLPEFMREMRERFQCMWVDEVDVSGDDSRAVNENLHVKTWKLDRAGKRYHEGDEIDFASEIKNMGPQPYDTFARTGKFTKHCNEPVEYVFGAPSLDCHHTRVTQARYYCKRHGEMIMMRGGKLRVAQNKHKDMLRKRKSRRAAEAQVVEQPQNKEPSAGSIPVGGKEGE